MLQKFGRRRRFRNCRRPETKVGRKSKNEPNDHYQNVDICLIYILDGLKPQKYYKKRKKRQNNAKNLKKNLLEQRLAKVSFMNLDFRFSLTFRNTLSKRKYAIIWFSDM